MYKSTHAYVSCRTDGELTDLVSYYTLPSTILGNPQYDTLTAAFMYYTVAKGTDLLELMNDALVLAHAKCAPSRIPFRSRVGKNPALMYCTIAKGTDLLELMADALLLAPAKRAFAHGPFLLKASEGATSALRCRIAMGSLHIMCSAVVLAHADGLHVCFVSRISSQRRAAFCACCICRAQLLKVVPSYATSCSTLFDVPQGAEAHRKPLPPGSSAAGVCCMLRGHDVFNALDIFENASFLKDLKFGIGDGRLRYYLYNWRLNQELKPGQVGLVLL